MLGDDRRSGCGGVRNNRLGAIKDKEAIK